MSIATMTNEQVKSRAKYVVQMITALGDTIKEAGPEGCPEGPLYAAFMTHGVGLEGFTRMVDLLISIKAVRRSNYVLYWCDSIQAEAGK